MLDWSSKNIKLHSANVGMLGDAKYCIYFHSIKIVLHGIYNMVLHGPELHDA